MTLTEAYEHMFQILLNYWLKSNKMSRDLGEMLSEFNTKTFKDRKPADPAAWEDWVDAVRKITPNDDISEEQTGKSMIELLKEYNSHQGFDLKDVIDYFDQKG